jgi:hypothetical protein
MEQFIEYPYRAKVVAPALSTSTNGFVFCYFATWEEAARCPGRIGPPEYAPGNAKGPRPVWLLAAMRAHGVNTKGLPRGYKPVTV